MTVESKLLLREEFPRDILVRDSYLNDGRPFSLTYMDKWTAIRFLLPIPRVPVRAEQEVSLSLTCRLSIEFHSTFKLAMATYSSFMLDSDGRRVDFSSCWHSRDGWEDAYAVCFVFLPGFRTDDGNLLYALTKCIGGLISVEVREAETIQPVNREVTNLFISDRMEPTKAILLAGHPFPFVQTTPATTFDMQLQ